MTTLHDRRPCTPNGHSAKPLPVSMLTRLRADPETGEIFRLDGRFAGHRVYASSFNGRPQVLFEGKRYLKYRVVWFLCTGEQPPPIIDHVNGVPMDCRMSNLRGANSRQNCQNRGRNKGKLLPKGVFKKRNKFRVQIGTAGGVVHVGVFGSVEEAAAAYAAAALEHHGVFARAD